MTLEDELEKAGREAQPDVDQLGHLGKLVGQMMVLRGKVAEQENILEGLKRDYHMLAVGEIPTLMGEMGLSEVRTQHGDRIVVQREVQCKFAEGEKNNALAWLELAGHGAIIKHEVTVAFGKNSEQQAERAMAALTAAGFTPMNIVDVHHATLKAWGKSQIESEAEIPGHLFAVNVFSIAKVK